MSASIQQFTVFGFASTHDALKAEEALLAESAEVALIPTPRALGTLCGFAVRVPAEDRTRALAILEAVRLVPDGEAQVTDRVFSES